MFLEIYMIMLDLVYNETIINQHISTVTAVLDKGKPYRRF